MQMRHEPAPLRNLAHSTTIRSWLTISATDFYHDRSSPAFRSRQESLAPPVSSHVRRWLLCFMVSVQVPL